MSEQKPKLVFWMQVLHTENCDELELLKNNDTKAVERHCKLIRERVFKHSCVK